MKKVIILSALIFISVFVYSQVDKNTFTAMFYNVENLFDIDDDPNTKDDEFTPEGSKKWNKERYDKKLKNLSIVISSIRDNELPELVGLCEVENRKVIQDLILQDRIKDIEYRFVHQESPDTRGIDVALLYDAEEFHYLNHKIIPVKPEFDKNFKSRDILYISGIINKTDTLHVFVNHWKSRWGGTEETEKYRVEYAKSLRNEIDQITSTYRSAKILVMGDLNDTPINKSVKETLKADNSGNKESLNNLMLPFTESGLGTHNYKGEWSVLDHIIVSNSLLNCTTGFVVKNKEAHIFSADWITYESKEGNKSPNRTYGGPNYYGGYSDHYPVYVVLTKQ